MFGSDSSVLKQTKQWRCDGGFKVKKMQQSSKRSLHERNGVSMEWNTLVISLSVGYSDVPARCRFIVVSAVQCVCIRKQMEGSFIRIFAQSC